MKIVPLPIPIAGLNTITPFSPIAQGYARELTNYVNVDGRYRQRPACRTELYKSAVNEWFYWLDYSSSNWYGIDNDGDIYDLTAGTTAANIGGTPQARATVVKHASLELIFGLRQPRLSVYPFTAWTFTTLGIVATAIKCGCSHKGRLYVTDGSTIEYSAIGQITGAIPGGNTFSISDVMQGETVIRMFSLTIQTGNSTETAIVMMGNQGRVLIYSGDYPGSTTWLLLGNYKMPRPASNVAFVEIDGDVFVATDRYAYWLRDLLQGNAQTAYSNSPSKLIENLWSNQYWVSTPSDVQIAHCFYIDKIGGVVFDVIVCQCFSLDLVDTQSYTNESIYLVYHRKYKSWAVWFMSPFFHPVVQKPVTGFDDPGFYAQDYRNEIKSLVPTYAVDKSTVFSQEPDIECTWKTPFVSPYDGKNQKVDGVRPFYNNNNSGYFHKAQAIFDFSDANAPYCFATQEAVTEIPAGKASGFSSLGLPDNTYDNYTGFINIGGIGGGVSFQFTQKREDGSSEQQVQGISAATAYITDGGITII